MFVQPNILRGHSEQLSVYRSHSVTRLSDIMSSKNQTFSSRPLILYIQYRIYCIHIYVLKRHLAKIIAISIAFVNCQLKGIVSRLSRSAELAEVLPEISLSLRSESSSWLLTHAGDHFAIA